jgi:hypothetical protein
MTAQPHRPRDNGNVLNIRLPLFQIREKGKKEESNLCEKTPQALRIRVYTLV